MKKIAIAVSILLLAWRGTPADAGWNLPRFKILVDVNQLNNSDATNSQLPALAADGVWDVTENNCGEGPANCGAGVLYPTSSQNSPDVQASQWPGVFYALNGANWIATEDEAIWCPTNLTSYTAQDFQNCTAQNTAPEQALRNNNYSVAQNYLQLMPIANTVNDVLAYYESFPPPCAGAVCEAVSDPGAGPTVTPAQIDAEVSQFGNHKIIIEARSYIGSDADPTSMRYWVDQDLNDPNSSGVVFEAGSNSTQNFQNLYLDVGLTHCLSLGKNCYLLLPPGSTSGNYAGELQAAVAWLNGIGVPLNNPNLYIVPAVYGRTGQNVGFLTGDGGSGAPSGGLGNSNSILGAVIALQNYRNSVAPQATLGSLDGVNTTSLVASGWALDPDGIAGTPAAGLGGTAQAINVNMYVDCPGGVCSGTPVGTVTANASRPDVNAVTGFPGNHGFQFTIPSQYLDGKSHTWYAYAVSLSGNAALNSKLSSPQTVTLNASAPVLSASANSFTFSATQGSNPVGQTLTVCNTGPSGTQLSWNVSASATPTSWLGASRAGGQAYSGVEVSGGCSSPPLTVAVNTGGLSPGTYAGTVSLTTNGGNASIPVSLTVAPAADITPPTTAITSPSNGATVSGAAVQVIGTASDNVGVTQVVLYVDGAVYAIASSGPNAFNFSWNSAVASNGSHTLAYWAYDASGNIGRSANVSVTVNNVDPLTVALAGAGGGSVASSPAGISCGSTCSANYAAGTNVTLTATPAGGSTFAGWSGGGCSGTGSCVTTMNQAQSVTATFSPVYSLTVGSAGTGSGGVTSSAGGINCPGTCSASYVSGTLVTLTANPGAGSTFVSWGGGGCAGSGTCVVTMSAAQAVTATFNAATYVLTTAENGSGTGSVTSSVGGINCPGTCSASYNSGTMATLTATPAGGSAFVNWSGAGCSGSGTCVVTMGAAQSVTATFDTAGGPYTLNVSKTGTGNAPVVSSPAGISCGATCSASYAASTMVTLTTTPTAGSTFSGWSGACSGTGSCVVTMSVSSSVAAAFNTVGTFALTVTPAGTGGGTVSSSVGSISCPGTCATSYASGTSVTLTATPAGGSTFAGWSGACSGTGSCMVTMSAAQAVTAAFAAVTYSLAVSPSGSGSGVVTSAPAGINCGGACSANYNSGASVALTAIPGVGSAFFGWSGACSGTALCLVTMSGAQSVGAAFNTGAAPPPASIASPVNGATVSGSVIISAEGTDVGLGVSKVQFYIDGVLSSTSTHGPYTYFWNSVSAPNGPHVLSAWAYDSLGDVGKSANVTISVNNFIPDSIPPTIVVATPAAGASLSSMTVVGGTAADNVAVVKVEFYVDNVLTMTQFSPPFFQFNWDTTKSVNGTHALTTKAYDAAGNAAVASLNVAVNNSAPGTTPPTVSLSTPVAGQSIWGAAFPVVAVAADAVRVTKVELYVDAALAETLTAAPYKFSLNTTQYANGAHALTAKAYDPAGNVNFAVVGATVANFYNAHLVGQTLPSQMTTGSQYLLSFLLTNTSSVPWDSSYALSLLDSTPWGAMQIALPPNASVVPGAQASFLGSVTAPAPGAYPMRWQLVHLGSTFGDVTSSAPVSVAAVALSTGVLVNSAQLSLNSNGTIVSLLGSGFLPGAQIVFSGAVSGVAQPLSVSATRIQFLLPQGSTTTVGTMAAALTNNAYSVAVINPGGGQSATYSFSLTGASADGTGSGSLSLSNVYVYPNPVVRSHAATFHIEVDGVPSEIWIKLYDLSGRLRNKIQAPAGQAIMGANGASVYEISWDMGAQGSGMYYYVVETVKAGGSVAASQTNRLAIVR